jgi:hypothetical protein
MCSGLLLCPLQTFGVLYVRRHRVQDSPSTLNERLIYQRRIGPNICQHSAVPVPGCHVALEPQPGSRGSEPQERLS